MTLLQSISVILVGIGAVFLLASIMTSIKTQRILSDEYKLKWIFLTCFMFFFLIGYMAFIIIELCQIDLPSKIITGMVFFGGALFVFFILQLTKSTLSKIQEGDNLLRAAKKDLETQVIIRTKDLETALKDLAGSAQKLENINSELIQILNSTADGIRVVGKDFITRRINQRFSDIVGISSGELVGHSCQVGCKNKHCDTTKCTLERIINGKEHIETESKIKRSDGKVLSCILTAYPYFNDKKELIGMVEGFRDITERKKMEKKLHKMTVTDELTGLLNRRGFLAMAQKLLKLGKRLESSIFLVYADLDNMKWINDNLGHEAGDSALIEITKILRTTFRKSDLICTGRLGGDEFAVLMVSHEASSSGHPVFERIEHQISEHNKDGHYSYELSLSVGIVKYDKTNPVGIEEFISMADEAMYQVKNKKKSLQQI